MKRFKVLFTVLVLALSVQGLAAAEQVSGEVIALDPLGSKISLRYVNPETSKDENLDVALGPETTFTGISSIADIQLGDLIQVQVGQDGSVVSITKEPSAEQIADTLEEKTETEVEQEMNQEIAEEVAKDKALVDQVQNQKL